MDAGMGMGGMDAQDSSFGLFTDDEEQAEDESVDDDIADADAEGFFDDDLVDDEEPEEEIDADIDDVFDDGDADAEEADAGEFDDIDGETGEFDDGEGFEEIGDDEFDDAGEDDLGGGDDAFDDIEDDELFDETVSAEETEAASPESESDGSDQGRAEGERSGDGSTGGESETSGASAGKPYLETLPSGLAGDLIVVEWLEYLVDELGVRGASEAIGYYETIDWITEDVAAGLDAHLGEFDPGGRESLAVEHHKRSLEYIDQLNGGDAETQRAAGFDRGGPLS
jgi:archaellum component FlaD/FlaE